MSDEDNAEDDDGTALDFLNYADPSEDQER